MKKRFNFGRLGALALALTLVTSCLTGGTLAKYTTSVSGTGNAAVAKWSFKAGHKNGEEVFQNFNLEKTADDTGVAEGKIAPGTTGTLPIYVELTGTEVATKITIEMELTGDVKLPENLTFQVTGDSTQIKAEDIEKDNKKMVKSIELSAEAAKVYSKDLSIQWNWPYDVSTSADTVDTANGKSIETANIKVTVTGTQLDKDPESSPTP